MMDALLNGIAALVVDALNALIAALAVALAAAIALLPDMPELPEPPAALVTAEAWVAWAFPVSTLIDCLLFAVTVMLLWYVVVIALRWAKASQ
jgi:hypothetical protein